MTGDCNTGSPLLRPFLLLSLLIVNPAAAATTSLRASFEPRDTTRTTDSATAGIKDSASESLIRRDIGRITGTVINRETGQPIADATVRISDTKLGAITGRDGRYTIKGVPAGKVVLNVRRIGYQSKTVVDLQVDAGGTAKQDISLNTTTTKLESQTITASAERGTVNEALYRQRAAPSVMNAVTAQQIARSPDSDAAQAMQRVSGVTVQDGKYVQVRGLGDRYTTASLNGARIPSPEPERKVVPFDLFPSSLLQTVTTTKTFTPDLSGDFAGAHVNIETREFPVAHTLTYSFSTGMNTAAARGNVPGAPSAGLEWLAAASGRRELPGIIRSAGNFSGNPSQSDINAMVGALRNSWSPEGENGRLNGSTTFSLGGSEQIRNRRLGYLLSGTYAYNSESFEGYRRAQANPGDVAGSTDEVDRYEGTLGRASVLWGGLLNSTLFLSNSSRLSVNAIYNRSADNEARSERGTSENLGMELDIRRLRYIEKSVHSVQLTSQHGLDSSRELTWSFTASGTGRREPDRSEIVYAIDRDPVTNEPMAPAWLSVNSEGAVRTFGDLQESSNEVAVNYRWTPAGLEGKTYLKFGGSYRRTSRDADNNAYSIIGILSRGDRELTPEAIFDGRFSDAASEVFRIIPLSAGGSYSARDQLGAGYGMVDWAIGERLRMVTGVRVERSALTLDAQPTVGKPIRATPEYTDILPSVAANVSVGSRQMVRVSLSQTVARPEYRDIAPIQYREVIGGDNVVGNQDLRRSRIVNVDVRWELYPSDGEILSVAIFGKRFDNPIEKIYLGTSGTRMVTFANAASADNYGVELELRQDLAALSQRLDGFTVFGNSTVMRSDVRLGSGIASKTTDHRRMVGQAPYVLNGGLTYSSAAGRSSATLLFNAIGERIISAAESPLPDVLELGRQSMDFSLRLPFVGKSDVRFDAKNLLDRPIEIVQGTVVRETYRTGRTFQFGMSFRK
jgi:outer membrane receptor for ferrienterochelin and colicin